VKHLAALIALLLTIAALECVEQYRAERCAATAGIWETGFFDACVYPRGGAK
jgi:hypothetical protein